MRPNAFVSVRVPSWFIRSNLQTVQEEMMREEPKLEPLMVSLLKLHITLMVLRLDTKEQEERLVHIPYLETAQLDLNVL